MKKTVIGGVIFVASLASVLFATQWASTSKTVTLKDRQGDQQAWSGTLTQLKAITKVYEVYTNASGTPSWVLVSDVPVRAK